uniref:C2H2-type domain-containing protein n=1 Tax=Meloidogyne incognita TaxID=6306 RepID=A0A914N2X2_MELIC
MKLSIFLLFCLFFILDLANSTKKNYGKSGQNNFNPSQYRDVETSETETTGQGGTGTGSIPSNTEGYTQEVNPSGLGTSQTLSNLDQALGRHPFLFSPQHQQMNVGGQGLMENQESDSYFAKCEWNGCGSVFSIQNDFVEHVKEHTKDQKGPCRNCFWSGCDGKSISFKNLSRHIRTHTGEKLYVCKYVYQNGVTCNKQYKSQENLKKHKRKHTGEIIRYNCAHCDKTFMSKQGKYYHENRDHSNANTEPVVRTFFLL